MFLLAKRHYNIYTEHYVILRNEKVDNYTIGFFTNNGAPWDQFNSRNKK